MEKNKSTYDMLSKIDVSSKTEKKGSLTYLSWAWAWAEAKKVCPTLIRIVYETEQDNIPKDVTPKMFTLDIGDANWKKVLGYVADNKELGLTKIVKNLGVKYKVTPKVKTELNKIIKS